MKGTFRGRAAAADQPGTVRARFRRCAENQNAADQNGNAGTLDRCERADTENAESVLEAWQRGRRDLSDRGRTDR